MSNDRDLTDFHPHYITSHGAIVGFSFDCPACPRNDAGGVHSIRIHWDAIIQPGEQVEVTVWDVKDRESFDRITVHPSIDGTPLCKFHGWIRDGAVTW